MYIHIDCVSAANKKPVIEGRSCAIHSLPYHPFRIVYSTWFFHPNFSLYLLFSLSLHSPRPYIHIRMCERDRHVPLARRPTVHNSCLEQGLVESWARARERERWFLERGRREVVSRQIHPLVWLRRARQSTSETARSFSCLTTSFLNPPPSTKTTDKNKMRHKKYTTHLHIYIYTTWKSRALHELFRRINDDKVPRSRTTTQNEEENTWHTVPCPYRPASDCGQHFHRWILSSARFVVC